MPVAKYPASVPPYYAGELSEAAPRARCDFVLLRALLRHSVEILKPDTATVGNVTAVKVRLRWTPWVDDPNRIHIYATHDGGTPADDVPIRDEFTGLFQIEPYIVPSYGCATAEFPCSWDTTGCWNDGYTLHAEVHFDSPFYPLLPPDKVTATRGVAVRNLVVR